MTGQPGGDWRQTPQGLAMSSSAEGSAVSSSYDSEHYGDVARAGFTRMYVLLHAAPSPIDPLVRSELVGDPRNISRTAPDEDALGSHRRCDPSTARTKRWQEQQHRYAALEAACEAARPFSSSPRFQLLYASGQHYFYGPFALPDTLLDQDNGDDDGHASVVPTVEDVPLLLPQFQAVQDELVAVEEVSHLTRGLRDVVYQMEEVGEFMVEELSKDKLLARIDEASREFHWMASPSNPTFFELQTHSATHQGFASTGVVLVVMKIVVRGVLLDIVYQGDSYLVALRENADELALEDTFIPNISCRGPCVVLRRYRDDDLKQLVLWCALPEDAALSIQGKAVQSSASPKVTPVPLRRATRLDANDTQFYCLLPVQDAHGRSVKPPPRYRLTHAHRKPMAKPTKQTKKMARKPNTRLVDYDDGKHEDYEYSESEEEEEEEEEERGGGGGGGRRDDNHECDAEAVFHFNEFAYSGRVRMRPSELNDLGTLSAAALPALKAQAINSLVFTGAWQDAGPTSSSSSAESVTTRASALRRRFDALAPVLLALLMDSQSWLESFLREVTSVAIDSATSSDSADWLGRHLSGWLEAADGGECFYELAIAAPLALLWGLTEDDADGARSEDVELLVWKGIVNAAVLVIVYRRGSFYMMVRELEELARMPRDGLGFFGLLPSLAGKGRGYLVRSFSSASASHTPRVGREEEMEDCEEDWLAGATLLLWQTSSSVSREEMEAEEAQTRYLRSADKRAEEEATAQWFQEEGKEEDKEEQRAPERTERTEGEAKLEMKEDGLSDGKRLSSSPPRGRDRVGMRHHLPPLTKTGDIVGRRSAPWEIHTGRPL